MVEQIRKLSPNWCQPFLPFSDTRFIALIPFPCPLAISVWPCQWSRSMGATPKDAVMLVNILHSYWLRIAFLSDSPLRSILCDEFTILSRIASAIVPSPIISYQVDTGIWEDMIVELVLNRSSIISINASLAWLSKACRPKSSSIRRSTFWSLLSSLV